MTLCMSILVSFLLNVLPFSFYFHSLLIFSFLLIYLLFFFYPEFDPGRLCPSPHPHPQQDLDLFIYIDHVASGFFSCSNFLTLAFFVFCFLFNPSFPSFPWQMFKTKLHISLLVLLSFLPFAPGFLKVCLKNPFYVFVYINNKHSFTVLNKWCFSANGDVVSPLKTLASP